jgi:hypothetical protein
MKIKTIVVTWVDNTGTHIGSKRTWQSWRFRQKEKEKKGLNLTMSNPEKH